MKLKILFLLLSIAVTGCSLSRLVFTGPSAQENNPPAKSGQLDPAGTLMSLAEMQTLWISPAVPAALAHAAVSTGIGITENPDQATLILDIENQLTHEQGAVSSWIYALVAPFPTITDEISLEDLQNAWARDMTDYLFYKPVWMEESTLAALKTLWGEPNPTFKVRIAPNEYLLDAAWDQQPSFAIIPFEDIQPRWKVIQIDGQSPLSRDFDPETYPLKISFSLYGKNSQTASLKLPQSNRDPQKLTILVMTGVTALVRTTALKMEQHSRTYPGEAIRDWLLNADLAHISNEIPFSVDCPYPDIYDHGLVFCSNPLNIALLDYIGTDIIELTGNHFQDWGSPATLYTLELYKLRNWQYFGGGANREDARKSIKIEHNGNNLAFIGCNPAGPDFAWATENDPGAARCEWDWVKGEITRLSSEGYLPIMTFQYYESYGIYPGTDQMADFRMMADAGAVIVSGSQAHLPKTMEFNNGSFIHYGLGNLFFDQMDYPVVGTKREFLDRHVFYNGEYINTELLTAMLEDYSRPRPMTAEEKAEFLTEMFTASGW